VKSSQLENRHWVTHPAVKVLGDTLARLSQHSKRKALVHDETNLESVFQGDLLGEKKKKKKRKKKGVSLFASFRKSFQLPDQSRKWGDVSRVLKEALGDNEALVQLALGLPVLLLNALEDPFKIFHVVVLEVLDVGAGNDNSLLNGKANTLVASFFER